MDKEPPLSTAMCKIFQIQQKIHVEKEYWLQILARNSSIEALAAFSLAFLLFSQVRSFCDTIPRTKCRVSSSSLCSPPQCNCPSRCPRRRSAGAKILRRLAVSSPSAVIAAGCCRGRSPCRPVRSRVFVCHPVPSPYDQ